MLCVKPSTYLMFSSLVWDKIRLTCDNASCSNLSLCWYKFSTCLHVTLMLGLSTVLAPHYLHVFILWQGHIQFPMQLVAGFFRRVKRPWLEVNLSPPPRAAVKGEWNFYSYSTCMFSWRGKGNRHIYIYASIVYAHVCRNSRCM